jgi:glyoxylase-like metal-dependent hydrolase (beta-lactamase superfamily II)
MQLPIAKTWYQRKNFRGGLTLITEPHVDILEQSNIWHLRGRDRDLLVDAGMGVVSLRKTFPDLFEGRETIAVATHTHLDHIGCIHEFDHRYVHRVEADGLRKPRGATLVSEEMDVGMRALFVAAGYPPLGKYLIHALPHEGYIPEDYELPGAEPTRILEEGDAIDLGDRVFTTYLTPGHSPGSISLYDPLDGLMFSGDVIYDGPLLYAGPGMNVADYCRSFEKLRQLAPTIIHAGHDPSFGRKRMEAIIEHYLKRWEDDGLTC